MVPFASAAIPHYCASSIHWRAAVVTLRKYGWGMGCASRVTDWSCQGALVTRRARCGVGRAARVGPGPRWACRWRRLEVLDTAEADGGGSTAALRGQATLLAHAQAGAGALLPWGWPHRPALPSLRWEKCVARAKVQACGRMPNSRALATACVRFLTPSLP